jgi:hypothetical protein
MPVWKDAASPDVFKGANLILSALSELPLSVLLDKVK